MGFQYNGKLRAPELLLRQPSAAGEAIVHVIREREVKADLFSNTRIPQDLGAGLPRAYPYTNSQRGGQARSLLYFLACAAAALTVASALALARKRALAK